MRFKRHLTRPLRAALRLGGYEIKRLRSEPEDPSDFGEADLALVRAVRPYTMTSPEAVFVLRDAVRYVVANDIRGAIVECGVWRGGSMLTVARTLLELGRSDVDLWLYDTFEGMPEPSARDVRVDGASATALLAAEEPSDESRLWARASLEDVERAMASVPYPPEKIHFVQGMVEDTIPAQAPESISLLRLDTDWYEPTRHELAHLYPRLSTGAVLVVDDYGWWRGAREATDEYFSENPPSPFLVRIDSDGRRVAVKAHV